MKSTLETRKLAQDILDYITEYPERHRQQNWVALSNDSDEYLYDAAAVHSNLNEDNICNTTMCVAGTAVYLTRSLEEFKEFIRDYEDYEEVGAELLGLDVNEAEKLFYSDNESAPSLLRAVAEGDEVKFNDLPKSLIY